MSQVEGISMGYVEELFSKMDGRGDQPAMVWQATEYSYGSLLQGVEVWIQRLGELGIGRGTVCGVMGDYSPEVCVLFFALIRMGAILVPFTGSSAVQVPELARLAGVRCLLRFDEHDAWSIESFPAAEQNDLIIRFLEHRHPGLVVFTSGSTGKPKGILHDCERVLRKFAVERRGYRTLLFLLMDHFGGFNTLMSVFAYGGTAIMAARRTPEEVCRTVAQARVELLPVTPTFLNLLLASKCYKDFDLSSVQLITYGTEVMPETTLKRIAEIFPSARLQQTYGLSELGVLRSKSKESDSVCVRIGGEGFETKVVDGMLYVRSQSAMIGYLNAPSPFDADGWMNTGDIVEVDGDYLRILGRNSEIINVGGQKVFPVEVETVLMEADNVIEATVYGLPNALMGSIVVACVSLEHDEDPIQLKVRLRKFCLEWLAPYKVPVRFTVVSQEDQYNERVKKIRRGIE
ncbi:long-chain fatty acid--CoA ligase [Acidobacteria bacterium AH-259-D05]|nr:long-chain fatty acid--CoA ligase [Acidobacteria bacterium AH-259-D05]